jgi:hypothetical protein
LAAWQYGRRLRTTAARPRGSTGTSAHSSKVAAKSAAGPMDFGHDPLRCDTANPVTSVREAIGWSSSGGRFTHRNSWLLFTSMAPCHDRYRRTRRKCLANRWPADSMTDT